MSFSDAGKFWNERFKTDEFIFGTEPNEFLKQAAPQYVKSGAKFLCVADGEGRNSIWLAKQGYQVDAFDISDVAVGKASQWAEQHQLNIRYSIADCDSWPWVSHSYDAIAAIFIQFADPTMRTKLFQNMVAALKPNGVLLLQGYTEKQIEYKTGGPSQIENLYNQELIKGLLSDLDMQELNIYEQELNEGQRHSGISALMSVVAVKRA